MIKYLVKRENEEERSYSMMGEKEEKRSYLMIGGKGLIY